VEEIQTSLNENNIDDEIKIRFTSSNDPAS
jgi:hypothetical protein